MTTFTKQQIKKWQDPSFEGFSAWLNDTKPMIIGANNRLIPFQLQDFQQEMFEGALTLDAGVYKYRTVCISWARRHSKSHCAALLCVWRVFTQPNQNICIFANSEKQINAIGFKICKDIIMSSPILLQQIGREAILTNRIDNKALNSSIRTMTCNVPALYGERISLAWLSELHAAQDDSVLQVIQSSQGDIVNAQTVIDTTTDTSGGILHRLENLAKASDRTIYFHRREYKNLQEALEFSPYWIDREWLKSREKQMLKAEFASQHLNLRQESTNTLFGKRSINEAKDKALPATIDNNTLQAIANGRKYIVGAGLDRAFAFSQHGDKTIYTVVAKVASDNPVEEPHYYVLRQENIFASLGKLVKQSIQGTDKEYKLHNICFESYNSQDLYIWAQAKGYNSELVFANSERQTPAFLELHRLFLEKRIHFSADLKELEQELLSFTYSIDKGKPKFGDRKQKDDRVYSLLWAVYSLRDQELNSYEIDSVVCDSKSQHAQLCFLRTNTADGLILHCCEQCQTFHDVKKLYNQYSSINLDNELSLQEFYANLVTNDGLYAVI